MSRILPLTVFLSFVCTLNSAFAQQGGVNGRLQGGGYGRGMQGMGRDFRDDIKWTRTRGGTSGVCTSDDKLRDSTKDSDDKSDSPNEDADRTADDLARDDARLNGEADKLWNEQAPGQVTENKIPK